MYLKICWIIAVIILIGACTEEGVQAPDAEQPKVVEDTPIEPQNCVGLKDSLAIGKTHAVYRVYDCLRTLALEDRELATQQARTLKGWDIRERGENQLSVLINVLDQFESDEALKSHLVKIGAIEDSGQIDAGLMPSSFLEAAGRTVWFDVETGMFPNYHDALMDEIAAQSPSLEGAQFTEVSPADYESEDPYRLLATFNGKEYELEAQNYGDWYDLDAVLTMLNMLTIDHGLADRFVLLPTGDQTAIVMAIPVASLQSLNDSGLLEKVSADDPMALGKEFEARVRATFE